MYAITNVIPAPAAQPRKGRRGSKYPFLIMRVGDSFFATNVTQPTLYQASRKAMKILSGSSFVLRETLENSIKGTRVWRVK